MQPQRLFDPQLAIDAVGRQSRLDRLAGLLVEGCRLAHGDRVRASADKATAEVNVTHSRYRVIHSAPAVRFAGRPDLRSANQVIPSGLS